ncbi:hypothetical protein ACFL03_02085 [Thermodesulfobacteriota bacterium]
MYSADVKRCAQQIVKEFFNDILIGEYQIPSLREMEFFLKENIDYAFDDYQATKKIVRSHPHWSSEQISDELERQKMRYENQYRTNLKTAAQNAVEEVENHVKSLRDAIKAWKISNLD